VGGGVYGQGMYSAGNYGTQLSASSLNTAQHCAEGDLGKVEIFTLRKDAKIITKDEIIKKHEQIRYNIVEDLIGEKLSDDELNVLKIMTGSSDIGFMEASEILKTIDSSVQEKIKTMWSEVKDEVQEKMSKLPIDNGQLGALLGYDAIEIPVGGAEDKYFIILNRTKMIIKED
jgi:hypothetical protein